MGEYSGMLVTPRPAMIMVCTQSSRSLAVFAAAFVFFLGYGLAAYLARRRLTDHAAPRN